MNPVLEKMLQTRLADEESSEFPLHSNMTADEGELIDRVFRAVAPDVSLEIGCAYGVSTLFACDALAANGKAAKHIVVDPFQYQNWSNIGRSNIARAGYEHFVEFLQQRSEFALPALAAAGTCVQAAIIDGYHTFDHTLVDFFYVNRMLGVGGIVIIDDTDLPAVSRVVEHILTYPAYEIFTIAAPPGASAITKRTKNHRTFALPFRRKRRHPTCMALRKIAKDDRAWNWHADF
ncbi:MAG TPA: class I SAM-dependent methyltransferase [Rhizomicrobium sp.]